MTYTIPCFTSSRSIRKVYLKLGTTLFGSEDFWSDITADYIHVI